MEVTAGAVATVELLAVPNALEVAGSALTVIGRASDASANFAPGVSVACTFVPANLGAHIGITNSAGEATVAFNLTVAANYSVTCGSNGVTQGFALQIVPDEAANIFLSMVLCRKGCEQRYPIA